MLSPVCLRGNYFSTVGKKFIPVGVNWVPARSGMQWPHEWDSKSVKADFETMKKMGVNLIRFDLLWGWFEPHPGQYNEEAFKQFDWFIKLAHRFDIYLNPAFFIGNEVGDAFWDVPWRNGRHPHADPEMLRLQAGHVEEFARRYAGEPAILAWDLTDEPPFWIVADSTSDAMAANWTRILCDGLRRYDPEHLIICGTLGQETGRGPFRVDIISPWVDLASVHPYPIYDSGLYQEPLLSTRLTFAPAFEIMLSRGAGHPVLMQEFGASSAQFSSEVIQRYYNTIMFSALAAGVMGYVAWCYTDAEPHLFERAPYQRWPHETQFGVTDPLGTIKPAGNELSKFSETLRFVDIDKLEPPALEAGIIVPHEWSHGPDYQQYGFVDNLLYQYAPRDILLSENDKVTNLQLMQSWLASFILCRQAGLWVGFPRELGDWKNLKLLLMPSPATTSNSPITHPYTTFWRKARAFVEHGSVLYSSICGSSAIPSQDMLALFGVSLSDRARWKPQFQLTLLENFHGLKKGETFTVACPAGLLGTAVRLDVKDAQVIAVDQDNQPVLLHKKLGKGHSVLCAFPLEFALGATPNSFENRGNEWRIYQALKQLAGIQSPFFVDNSTIEVGWLSADDADYVVLVNHSPDIQSGSVGAAAEGQAFALQPDGLHLLRSTNKSWPYEIPAFTGCIYRWEYTPQKA